MTQIASLPPPDTFRKEGKDYRRWTIEHKRQIVEESFRSGTSVSIVARRHNVNTNQVFKWRQEYQRGELGRTPKAPPSPGFIPVGVIEEDGQLSDAINMPVPKSASPLIVPPPPRPAATLPPQGIIEVVLRQGVRVRCKGNVDLAVLSHAITTAAGLP